MISLPLVCSGGTFKIWGLVKGSWDISANTHEGWWKPVLPPLLLASWLSEDQQICYITGSPPIPCVVSLQMENSEAKAMLGNCNVFSSLVYLKYFVEGVEILLIQHSTRGMMGGGVVNKTKYMYTKEST